MTARTSYHVGDRVEDCVNHRRGEVIYIYDHKMVRDELVAVRFDDRPDVPLACHVLDLRRVGRRA